MTTTGGRLPRPNPSTISSGTAKPVAVFPPNSTFVVNRMTSSFPLRNIVGHVWQDRRCGRPSPGSELPPPDVPSPELIELAHAHRVATEFWDWRGAHRPVSRRTIVAALGALDVDASTPDAIASARVNIDERPWRRLLPATVVMVSGTGAHLMVHVPHGDPGSCGQSSKMAATDGRSPQVDRLVEPRLLAAMSSVRRRSGFPAELPLGYHTLRAATPGRRGHAARSLSRAPAWSCRPRSATAELGVHDPALLVALAAIVGSSVISPTWVTWWLECGRARRGVRARQPAARCRTGGSDGAVAVPPHVATVRQPGVPARRGRSRGRLPVAGEPGRRGRARGGAAIAHTRSRHARPRPRLVGQADSARAAPPPAAARVTATQLRRVPQP